MENQTVFSRPSGKKNANRLSALRSSLRPILAILALCGALLPCLFAQRSAAAPQRAGISARYLGVLEPESEAMSGLPLHPQAVIANPVASAILSFKPAAVGVDQAAAQQLTASFSVSGYSGSFAPTATLHYGHDYTVGVVTCTVSGASETCNVPVAFQPALPGARKDAIFLMDGTTRLATVLLGGVGQAPFSLLQPGAFSTSIPTNDYIYQSIVDENGIVYILPAGNRPYIESVTKAGVATQIPLVTPPYFWSIGIDGAGVLYVFGESGSVTTYDTVQGTQGAYLVPNAGSDANWYPGAVAEDGTIYIVNQIHNNGAAYEFEPNGGTGYAITLDPGVLQPSTAAVDSAGDFFVGGYEINKITPAGVQTQVNTVGASEGLAVDAAETLYATRYSPTDGVAQLPASDYSTPISSFGRSSPLGMSLGSDGTLYLSNYINLDIFDRSAETIDFGEVDATKSQPGPAASVYNGGNEPLTISDFRLTGAGFSLDPNQSNECASGTVLPPGSLCPVSVIFAPGHPGNFSGTISLTSNSLNGVNTAQTIQLTGISYGSYDVLSPSPLAFASHAPGSSTTQAVSLTNEGNSYASTIYSVATDNPVFAITQGSCSGVAVQPGANCQLQVTFSPTGAQAYSGNATIVTYVSGTGQPFLTITLPLSGSGLNPAAAAPVLAPGTGTYSSSQQVSITDATPSATIYYTTDGSIPSAASLKYTGAITVNSNETVNAIATAAGFTQSSTASATYTFKEPVATVTPTSLAFGNQVQDIASIAQMVTLKNTGSGALTIIGFPITGSTDFSQTNNCAGSLTAGSSCTVSVIYTPTSLGNKTATLTISSDSIKAAPTVALTGTGIAAPVATLAPGSLNFGKQQQGSASAVMILMLSNPSSSTALNFDSISISGVGAASFSQTNNCGAAIAAGGHCSISVTFTPNTVGAISAALALVTRYPAFAPVSVSSALSGIGVAPPTPTFTPSTLGFGNQIVATTSASRTTTLTNTGTDALVIDGALPTILGTGAASISAASNCPATLARAATCTVSATFTPSSVGAYSLSLQMMAHYSGTPSIKFTPTVALTGTGIVQPQVLTFSPASLNFGNQVVNTDGTLNVTVTNISTTDTVFVGDVFNTSSAAFNAYGASCMTPLAPGKSCKAQITFTPTEIQAYSGTVTFQPQAAGCGGCTRNYPAQTLAVTGTSIAPSPVLTFSPASLGFGNQIVNVPGGARSVTVTNISTTDTVAVSSFTIQGLGFLPQPSACLSPIAPGASCAISFTFSPSELQAYSATVTIQVQPSGCGECSRNYPAQTFNITGTGVNPPPPTLTPTSLAFGSQAVGATSASQTLTLTNPAAADQPIAIGGFVFEDTFSFHQSNNCPATLPAGASCQVEVSFAPPSVGVISDTLRVNYVEEGLPAYSLAALTGAGTAPPLPAASLSPASFSFSSTVGTTSAAQTATLTNNGAAPLTILNISALGGAAPEDYSQTNNCGMLLAVGASCTISVTFTPANPGSYPSTLTVSDNDPASPQTITLAGSGTSTPDFVVASSTPPQSIPPGGSVQFSFAVTAQNGATIPAVSLTATGLPPGATATFSHSTVTPGSTSATATLTIQTAAATTAANNIAWPMAAPALALIGWCFVPGRRRHLITLGVLLFTSLGSIMVMGGCGGGSMHSSPTPPKTYLITVMAAIGKVQQTTTVQLTVN